MKKSLLALTAVMALAIPTSTALAYPAGQNPVMSFSTVGRIIPGNNVNVQISRVKSTCSVSVAWTDTDEDIAAVTKTIRATGKSGVISIATPSTAGVYTLSSTISAACAGTGSPFTLSKSITVGKIANIVGKVKSTSGYVSKTPTVSVTATVKSGSTAISSKSLNLQLRKNGVVIKTETATTNGSGQINHSFTGTSYTAGNYDVVITLASGTIYGETSLTTSVIKLR